jgi:hypothetical protein
MRNPVGMSSVYWLDRQTSDTAKVIFRPTNDACIPQAAPDQPGRTRSRPNPLREEVLRSPIE